MAKKKTRRLVGDFVEDYALVIPGGRAPADPRRPAHPAWVRQFLALLGSAVEA